MTSTGLSTRSATAQELDTPAQILIKPSRVDPEKLGVWCKEIIKEGTRYGPFVGEKAYEVDDSMDPAYIWEIVDVETKEFLFYINATNPQSGNWMRHINSARYFEEQNIVSEQDGIDIFYQAIKDIVPGEELLTWFEKSPLRRRKGKRRSFANIKRAKTGKPSSSSANGSRPPPPASAAPPSTKEDAYADVNVVSQRGRKRNVKKYWKLEAVTDSDANHDEKPETSEEEEEELFLEGSDEDWEERDATKEPSKATERSGNASSESSAAGFFQFELQAVHTGKNRLGRKVFQCDICSGIYRHSFSLKRHYIRNHVSYRYVSKVDRLNCGVVPPADAYEDEGAPETIEESGREPDAEAETTASGGNESRTAPDSKAARSDIVEETDRLDTDAGATSSRNVGSKKSRTKSPDTSLNGSTGAATDVVCDGSSKSDDRVKERDRRVAENSSTEDIGDRKDAFVEQRKPILLLLGLYRCNICEQMFDEADQLRQHFLNHPDFPSDKKFACQHCNMKFQYKQNLMRHEVVHTGAKPYTCNHCDKRFPTLTNQKRHERIHKGQKFTCGQCPGTFTQTGDLKKHMCKQHPETYHECAYCSKYFPSELVLVGHLHKAHTKDIDANHLKICARKKARKVTLEKDRAESRRLASSDQLDGKSSSSTDSSLQFACTVCRKRFRDYSNMCRHRRLAHERDASNAGDDDDDADGYDDGALDGDFTDTDSQPGGDKIDALQTYFSRVSHNIADNLQYFIEGKEEQLTKASSHIRWKQKGAQEKLAGAEQRSADVRLEEFNFPHGFHLRQLSELYEAPAVAESLVNDLDDVERPAEDSVDDDDRTKIEIVGRDRSGESPTVGGVSDGEAALFNHVKKRHERDVEISATLVSKGAATPTICEKSDIVDDMTPVDYCIKSCDVTSSDVIAPQASKIEGEEPLDLSVSSTSCDASMNASLNETKLEDNDTTAVIVVADTSPSPLTSKIEGKKPKKKFLCLVCFREFLDVADLHDHQGNKHASVDCRHVEVDMDFTASWCKQPRAIGTLNVSSSQLPVQPGGDGNGALPYLCTKCKQEFPSSAALHQHISDCGDYWRHLSTRVTWVFVLRGSELPMDKVAKKRGKFHWSSSCEESSRRQLQKMLLQQHLGEAPSDGAAAVGRRNGGGRSVAKQRSIESMEEELDARRNRWRHGGQQSAYNPRRHVRRREMAELLDVQRCYRCGEEFKTILQLERHIPACAEKSRISSAAEKTATENGGEENNVVSEDENDYDPTKHMCIYCERQFTYLRMLRKHVNDTCVVRREFVEKGEYIDDEWEREIVAKLQQAASGRGDSGQATFTEPAGVDDCDGGTTDGRRGKRRRRGNNWGCRAKVKKSFTKSSKSSDDGDSLFGWEDTFLSASTKNDAKPTATTTTCDNGVKASLQLKTTGQRPGGNDDSDGPSSSALHQLLVGPINPELHGAVKATDGDCDKTLGDVEIRGVERTQAVQETSIQGEGESPTFQSTSGLNRSTSDEAEPSTAVDVKQRLIRKIESKRVATRSSDNEDSKKSPVTDSSDNGPNDIRTADQDGGLVAEKEEEEDLAVEERGENKGKTREANVSKARKRRGPRLTMRCKKRKPETPPGKTGQPKNKE